MTQKRTVDKPNKDLCMQNIKELQEAAAPAEKQMWIEKGARKDCKGLCRNPEGKIIAPAGLLNLLCQEAQSRGSCASSKK